MFLNNTIVITGASSGLGASLANELASYKPNLVLFSRDLQKLQQTLNNCNEKGASAIAIKGDVTIPEDCKKLVDETINTFDSIDHLVLNAGISMWAKFEEITDLSLFSKLIETNYLSAVQLIHLFLPHLKNSKGMITAISSIQGEIAVPNHSGYVASKHALAGFLNTLRIELRHTGVDIMLVKPHWLRGTDLRKNAFNKDGAKTGEAKKEHSKESISLQECSRKILKGMANRKRELVIPSKLNLLVLIDLLFPELAEKIILGKVNEQE
ncbi:MAG: SDR family oxidoreductase [Ignavibacteriales bacterium]|nr:MAG: SDR family oxidoreductase [Ignavibacteriales bacterium]